MRRRRVLGGVAGVALLGVGGHLGVELFAPERATRVDEDRTGGDGGAATVLLTGEFVGTAGHDCAGTVELAADGAGRFLQFRDYEQTPGPDVCCYPTPDPDPDTTAEMTAGRKVFLDGGADGGEVTETGTFPQRLPDDVDPDGVLASGSGVTASRSRSARRRWRRPDRDGRPGPPATAPLKSAPRPRPV
jgi:hypothetical protein